ncbi:MAG: DNA-binding protein [Janthinobacterium lividum]
MRDQFVASGTNVSEWARERHLSLKLVHQILRGERSCRRGESHRIAVALGIKVSAPTPGRALAHDANRMEPAR